MQRGLAAQLTLHLFHYEFMNFHSSIALWLELESVRGFACNSTIRSGVS